MPIKGLSGIKQDNLGRVEISVFKGARKGGNSAGKDLQTKFRIVTENLTAKTLLKACYGEPDHSGDFFTETIEFYFCADYPEENFSSSMRSYNAAGNLIIVCDREIITKQRSLTTDSKGNVFNSLKHCSIDCPIKDAVSLAVSCPNKCVKHGELTFYLRSILDANIMIPGRLVVHSYEDIVYLESRLQELYERYQSLSNSPFPFQQTKHKIPFTLSRTKVAIRRPQISEGIRTGKSAKGFTYSVCIENSDPVWNTQLNIWNDIQYLKQSGYELPVGTIASFLKGNKNVLDYVLQSENSEKLLPPSNINSPNPLEQSPQSNRVDDVVESATSVVLAQMKNQARSISQPTTVNHVSQTHSSYSIDETKETIDKEEWLKINDRFLQNGWSKNSILLMLRERMGYTRAGMIKKNEVKAVYAIANDKQDLEYWLGRANLKTINEN